MALYYVTGTQIGTSEATLQLFVQKSTDAGATWTTTVSNVASCDIFQPVQVGTKIYIFSDGFSNSNLWVFIYDTATDTVDAGTDFGIAISSSLQISASALSTGKILVTYLQNGQPNNSVALYDPLTNTLGTPSSISSITAFGSSGQVTDSNDITYIVTASSSVITVIPVDASGVPGAAVTAYTSSFVGSLDMTGSSVSPLAISGGKLILGVIDQGPYSARGNSVTTTLFALRSVLGMTPSFGSPETVVAGLNFWNLNARYWYDAAFIDKAGTLYAYYFTNATTDDGAGSQLTLSYATSSGPGVWSAPTVAWVGGTPTSGLSVYPLLLASGVIGMVVGSMNPVTAYAYVALGVNYLASPSYTPQSMDPSQFAFPLNSGPTRLLFEVGGTPTTTLTFNFRVSEVPTPNPGPIINPTQCIEQDGTTSGGGGAPLPPLPPPIPPGVTSPVITTLTVPGGTVGFFYPAFAFSASGTGPITWHATGLPPSLGLSINGFLFGNVVGPAGTFPFQVTATNSSGTSAPVTFSITIGAFGVAPSITNVSPLPNANVGTPYAITFTANGTAPITWSSLIPINTFFDPVTAIFSFTPTAVGVVNFQVRATNGAGDTGLLPFSITVDPPAIPIPPVIPTPPGG